MNRPNLLLLGGFALLVFVFHVVAAPLQASGGTGEKPSSASSNDRRATAIRLLEGTRAKIEKLKSVRAEFTQEKRLSMLVDPVVSSGEFLYKAGRKFVWHYLPPDESFTISDGTRIWLYFPALAQAEVYDTEKFKTRSRAFEKLCLGFERPLCDLADVFSIELIGETRTDFEVLLRPREEVMARLIAELRILISRETGLPLRFNSLEPNGDKTTIHFRKTKLNPDLADSLFTFAPPEGVTVDKKQNSLSY